MELPSANLQKISCTIVDRRGYRFTLADSTGGDILSAAGGTITRGQRTIAIPEKANLTLEQAETWLAEAGKQLKYFVDEKAGLREQAAQAMQFSNSFTLAARNAMQDANAALQLNLTLAPKTYSEVRKLLAKDFGGDALDKKIIAYAEEQTQKLGCFVAGTLVHTKEGLRPIEQIKVGDWVLSKPESGEGESSYKRVTRTFEYDDREVWFLAFVPLKNGKDQSANEAHLVVTSAHPIWVKELQNGNGTVIKDISTWVRADRLFLDYLETGACPIFELQNGQLARLTYAGPVLRVANANHGLICNLAFWRADSSSGVLLDFSEECPNVRKDDEGLLVEIDMDIEGDATYDERDASSISCISGGYHPLLRKVFNLEVEDHHTYFVGNDGVWVHNTSGDVLVKLQNPKFSPAESLGIFVGEKAEKRFSDDLKARGNKGIGGVKGAGVELNFPAL